MLNIQLSIEQLAIIQQALEIASAWYKQDQKYLNLKATLSKLLKT